MLEEIEKLIELYTKASENSEKIADRLCKSVLRTEEHELLYHYSVFKNVRNYIASKMNEKMKEDGYQGFKEESMMLEPEIVEEKKKFKKWEEIAFDNKNVYTPGPKEMFKGDPEKIFGNSQDWEKLAFDNSKKQSKPTVLKAINSIREKLISSGVVSGIAFSEQMITGTLVAPDVFLEKEQTEAVEEKINEAQSA